VDSGQLYQTEYGVQYSEYIVVVLGVPGSLVQLVLGHSYNNNNSEYGTIVLEYAGVCWGNARCSGVLQVVVV